MIKQTIWLTDYGVRAHAKGHNISSSFSLASPGIDMSTEGWVKIMDIEIPESALPSRDKSISATVDKLEKAAKDLQAETQVKLNIISGEINSLLSLENGHAPPDNLQI
jgi:hypothetical protein